MLTTLLTLAPAFGGMPSPGEVSVLSGPLSDAAELWERDPTALQTWRAARSTPSDDDAISVVFEADAAGWVALELQDLGIEVEARGHGSVQARVPFADLVAVSGLPGLRRLREPYMAKAKSNTGDYVTEAVEIMGVGPWHDKGHAGQGVDVAILDVGFAGYKERRGTELPRWMKTHLKNGWDESDHGTAVAEVIHDMAPKADLHLYHFRTDVEFEEAIDAIAGDGIEVVNASIGFDNIWHADGTSPWSEAVDELVYSGVSWVAAAGNENDKYRVGQLSDEDHDGKVEIDGVEGVWVRTDGYWELPDDTSASQVTVSFRWSEPMDGAAWDIDLGVWTEDGELCAWSTEVQNGDDAPLERVEGWCRGSWVWVVPYVDLADDVPLTALTGYLYGDFGIDSDSWSWRNNLTLPGDAGMAFTVGACDPEHGTAPDYASRGPTDDGRIKPDLCAPTDVSTSVYGPLGFQGTSAAAPHVAGALALAMGVDEATEPELAWAWMSERLVDMGEQGPDDTFGAGALWMGEAPGRLAHCNTVPVGGAVWAGCLGLLLAAARRRRRVPPSPGPGCSNCGRKGER